MLDACCDLKAEDEVLYNSVYTLFCAMPWRLVPGTTLYVHTLDVPGGVELAWECREAASLSDGDLRRVLRQGPHGDLVDIACAALEQFCGLRAGECLSERALVPASPHFPRGEAVQRRVRAYLPISRADGLASHGKWRERTLSGPIPQD